MLASAKCPALRQRSNKVRTNIARVLRVKARTNPGCQICSQVAVAVALNSNAGRHSQTTMRLISEAALGPRRLVRRQMKPTRIRAKMGSRTLNTEDIIEAEALVVRGWGRVKAEIVSLQSLFLGWAIRPGVLPG